MSTLGMQLSLNVRVQLYQEAHIPHNGLPNPFQHRPYQAGHGRATYPRS